MVLADIRSVLKSRGNCIVGIVGGRTAPGMLDAIVGKAEDLDGRIEVFWLDERISPEKNYAGAVRYLERLRGKMVHVFWHPIKTAAREDAVKDAEKMLQHIVKLRGQPEFDVVILSAGEDGHIASLFPRHKALKDTGRGYVLVDNAPKPPPVRVTVSPSLLLSARHGYVFFSGAKADAYARYLDPSVSFRDAPVKLLNRLPELTVCVCLK